MFQSTHPHGVRRDFDIDLHSLIPVFQSTHPHGVRPNNAQSIANDKAFQSTHPHGVRHACSRIPVLCIGCFNPRTHTGCDFAPFASGDYAIVSIHAPTRGATSSLLQPVRRSDGFQSTHPHGVRLGGCRGAIINKKVSIHAPTRGATKVESKRKIREMFQSTHPHGVRLILCVDSHLEMSFNPRTHTGCDHKSI